MTDTKTDIQLTAAPADVDITAADDEDSKPTFRMVAYNGGLMEVRGWGLVAIELAGLELPDQIQIYASHKYELDGLVGSGKPEIRNGQLIVSGTLTSATEVGKQIIQLGRDGVPLQASVGVDPDRYDAVRRGETMRVNGTDLTSQKGFTHIKAAKLYEVSILPRGADNETDVRIAATNSNGDKTMTEQIAEAEKEFENEEAERIEAIESVCAKYEEKVDGEKLQNLKAEAIEGERDVKDLTLSLLRASRPNAGSTIQVGAPVVNDREKLTAAMLSKGAPSVANRKYEDRPEVLDYARENRMKATDICEQALRAEHRSVPQNTNAMIRAAFSTDTLASTLRDVGNDVLLDAYRRTPSIWRSFASVRSVPDFKEHTAVRPSDIGGIQQVAPGGELKHVQIDGTGYTFSVDTWGALMVITRQQMVNDNIGAYTQTAEELGRRCARKVNDLVAQVLLDVSVELSDTDLDGDGLSAAVQALRNRTDADGDVIDLQPAGLIVPPALEETARGLLQSGEIEAAEGEPTGNVWKNTAELLVEPRLSNDNFEGNSSGRWILTGAPQDAPVIVAFLGGDENPNVEQLGLDADANTLGFATRVYGDYGAAEGDTEALVPAEEA